MKLEKMGTASVNTGIVLSVREEGGGEGGDYTTKLKVVKIYRYLGID